MSSKQAVVVLIGGDTWFNGIGEVAIPSIPTEVILIEAEEILSISGQSDCWSVNEDEN